MLIFNYFIYSHNILLLMQNLTYLLLGIRDSLSLDWLKSILFYSHPQTGELHP